MKTRPCLRCEDAERCAKENMWKDCGQFLDYMRYLKNLYHAHRSMKTDFFSSGGHLQGVRRIRKIAPISPTAKAVPPNMLAS